ncbi:Imm49 family immunity protein [Streptomyces sp. G-G2]|uniref:Imm49 family immunity protein n=1 Tax=Streptomyces sp. G-G2 TaxID=3046201 RepID=UPI0024BAD664|nr:Imm49 family immunity protein [Streptomyces sp. G-G2]MDJ0382023.1 Imm49 family immunity protein [Streptomyces sp. G-G2]
MRELARHPVGEELIARALDGIDSRAFGRWHDLRYARLSLEHLKAMGDELADHVAARTLEDPQLARTWLDAFALCLVSGMLHEDELAIGLVMRHDFAPALYDGVPYSRLDSLSEPGELAEMDALCAYLTEASGHLPRDRPPVTVCTPDAEERAGAARQLDDLGALTADQRLLRVLLDDDRGAFERALAERLEEYRESESTASDASDAAVRGCGRSR